MSQNIVTGGLKVVLPKLRALCSCVISLTKILLLVTIRLLLLIRLLLRLIWICLKLMEMEAVCTHVVSLTPGSCASLGAPEDVSSTQHWDPSQNWYDPVGCHEVQCNTMFSRNRSEPPPGTASLLSWASLSSEVKQSNVKQSNAKQCNAKQSKAKQSKAMQCKAKQSKAKQSKAKQYKEI